MRRVGGVELEEVTARGCCPVHSHGGGSRLAGGGRQVRSLSDSGAESCVAFGEDEACRRGAARLEDVERSPHVAAAERHNGVQAALAHLYAAARKQVEGLSHAAQHACWQWMLARGCWRVPGHVDGWVGRSQWGCTCSKASSPPWEPLCRSLLRLRHVLQAPAHESVGQRRKPGGCRERENRADCQGASVIVAGCSSCAAPSRTRPRTGKQSRACPHTCHSRHQAGAASPELGAARLQRGDDARDVVADEAEARIARVLLHHCARSPAAPRQSHILRLAHTLHPGTRRSAEPATPVCRASPVAPLRNAFMASLVMASHSSKMISLNLLLRAHKRVPPALLVTAGPAQKAGWSLTACEDDRTRGVRANLPNQPHLKTLRVDAKSWIS
jgi:hypothetical protein